MLPPELHRKHRAFRARHQASEPPFVGLPIRKGDALALAAGVVPDSIRQAAREAVDEFWPELLEQQQAAS